MMSANVEGMVREGIAAFKEGRKDEARALLSKAVELDQLHEQAWMYLSGCVESVEDQRICLENVLEINPLNERARKGLAYLDGQNVDFSKPKPTSSYSSLRDVPTSVEWENPIEGQRPAVQPAAEPISDEEYDNWVTGLNLANNTASGAEAAPKNSSTSSPFTSADFDDDLFNAGPFNTADLAIDTAPPPKTPEPKRRTFDFAAPAAVLSTDDLNALTDANKSKKDKKDAKRQSREEKRAAKEAAREEKRASRELAKTSLAASTQDVSIKTAKSPDLFMPEAAEHDYTLFDDINADGDDAYLEDGEGELFTMIPKEIKPTRLPGTRERYPLIGVLLLIALILLNLGALGVLIVQFAGALPRG